MTIVEIPPKAANVEICTFERSQKPTDTDLASRILFYIDENFKNDISLSTLANNFGYSSSYISRYFKDCFNIGFNRYLNILRLKNALLLMNKNKYDITYCALESGFNSIHTFYRAFRNEFKCTLKEYYEFNKIKILNFLI